MLPERINYLHYGDALPLLSQLNLEADPHRLGKANLLSGLPAHVQRSPFVNAVIRSYGDPRARLLDVRRLRDDLTNTVRAARLFSSLGCRGFSYRLVDDMEWDGEALRPEINLRVALLAQPDLFYPTRVRRYLRRTETNHYRSDGFASIAFALGTISHGVCVVLVMQSDVAYRSPSYVREHFRGWRKVLFTGIIERCRDACSLVLVPSATDVHACRMPCNRPLAPAASWHEVYDRTATEFGLTPMSLCETLNIQALRDLDPVMCQQFYGADPRNLSGGPQL